MLNNKSGETSPQQGEEIRARIISGAEFNLHEAMVNLGYFDAAPQIGEYDHEQTAEFSPIAPESPIAHIYELIEKINRDTEGTDLEV